MAESDAVVGNVDILPTFLSLAGIKYDSDTYDGIDMSPYMMQNDTTPQRDVWLSQYISIGTKCLDYCPTWYPGKDGSVYPGVNAHGPCYDDNNQAWMIDENTVAN